LFLQLGVAIPTRQLYSGWEFLKSSLDTDIFKSIEKVYFVGLIDDDVIENSEGLFENKFHLLSRKKITSAYEGLMVFVADLTKTEPTV
jgi:hypothetical protein